MAIISEIQEHKDDPMGRVDLVDYNSSDYDEFLSDDEVIPTPVQDFNANLPPPPPKVTVTIHMEGDEGEIKRIRN